MTHSTSIHHSPFYLGPRPYVTKIPGVTINVEGTPIPSSVEPFILGGRTLCQLRPFAEAMGAAVDWDNNAQRVTMTLGNRVTSCQVGSEVGVMNGRGYMLDEPPLFVGPSVVVPVRFIAEALGYQVDWDETQLLVNLRRTT